MNIKISKNAHTCAACGTGFTHEQTLTSTVRVVEGALQREDFCTGCWENHADKKAYSVWKTVYFDPNVHEDEPPEVFSPLRQLFYEAVEEDSRVEMAKAFLAAGLLRRQKVFRRIKESDESDGQVRITLYTDRIGNRLIEVPDPHFTYAEMEEARTRLLTRLQELEAPPEASVADTDENVPDGELSPPPENPEAGDGDAFDEEDAIDGDVGERYEGGGESDEDDEYAAAEKLEAEGGESSSLDVTTHKDEEATHAQA